MELMPGYKHSDVGVIPDDWDAKTIGEEIDLLTGFPFPSSGYSKSGVRLLRGSNIKRGQTDWSDDIAQYWPEVSRELARYSLQVGDLVVSMDGSLVGRSFAQLSDSDLPALLLQRVARIRGKKMDVTYLRQFVGSDQFIKYVDSVKTVTAIPHISPGDIRRFTIPVPPTIEEQRAIAQALSDVDALLATLDQVIAKKRDLRQAAMQQLLTGETRLPGFSGNWEVKTFSAVLNRLNAKAHQIQASEYQETGKFPVVDQGKEFVVGFSDREEKRFRCPDGGVIVFGDHTCIVKFINFDFLVGADGTQIIHGKHGQNTRFHALQLQYRGIETTGYNRHFKTLKEREFFVPPLPEQDAIASALSSMDDELSVLEAYSEKTRNIKQAMMQELLTGKTRLVETRGANA
ncbi:TPA: restriction endonuclease subunit S [Stenotrophomonas maltophilia]|uniref:restriction endonuclease subunit S n=1 Tax=Stenotrophomonas maltophilia TaxID=40324 RepID=UPI0018D44E22|nr:restriction endonuclease subunit S [Stenotrophomonas maltophilia]